MKKRNYITMYDGREVLTFLQVPTILLDNALYSDLPAEAILLYSELLNIMSMSITNKDRFADEHGRIYILYSVEQICSVFHFERKKAMRLLKSLEDAGLITRKRGNGMDRSSRIYVRNYAAPLMTFQDADADEVFPYFCGDCQAEIFSYIPVPYAMLDDPAMSSLSLDAILLYCMLLDRLKLSYLNGSKFVDDEGNYFVYFGVTSIMEKLHVSNKTAVRILQKLDDVKGIGLVHKERTGQMSNANKLYVKAYSADFLFLKTDKESNEMADENKKNEASNPLRIQQVPFVHYRKSQNDTIESPISTPSMVPFVHYQKSQNDTIESPDSTPSMVPFVHPIHNNNNHKSFHKNKSYPFQSNQKQATDDDIENDRELSSEPSFEDSFAKAINLNQILPDPSFADSQTEKEDIENDRKIYLAIFDELVRACTTGDDDRYLKVSSIHMSRKSLRKELLSLDESMFQEIVSRIKSTKTQIKHWDTYIVTVTLDVKRHQLLTEMNMGNHIASL